MQKLLPTSPQRLNMKRKLPQRPQMPQLQQPKLLLPPDDDELLDCLRQSTGIAESSKAAYLLRLEKLGDLHKLLWPHARTQNHISDFILHAKQSIQELDSKDFESAYEVRTRQSWCSAICALFRHTSCARRFGPLIISAWKQYNKRLCEEIAAMESTNVRTQREERAKITLKEARDLELSLRKTEMGSPRHLLLAWHCLWPPNRGGDAGLVWFVESKSEARSKFPGKNVLVWNPSANLATFLLTDHKTAKHVGTIERNLPPILIDIVRESLHQEQGQSPRECLFVSPLTGEPFHSEKSYTAWATRTLESLFQRPITINSLRHAFVNALDLQRMSTSKLDAVAKAMGHTIRTQQRSYRRVEKDDADLDIIFTS